MLVAVTPSIYCSEGLPQVARLGDGTALIRNSEKGIKVTLDKAAIHGIINKDSLSIASGGFLLASIFWAGCGAWSCLLNPIQENVIFTGIMTCATLFCVKIMGKAQQTAIKNAKEKLKNETNDWINPS